MSSVREVMRAVMDSEMPDTGRHIMHVLAFKANWETGVIPAEFTPSLSEQARMTALSKSTVAEWLGVLDATGWLKRDRPPKGSKDERTGYTLLIGSSYVPKPQRASRRPATTASRPPRASLPDTDTADTPPSSSPPGGPVRQADSFSGPPGGTAAVRPADTGSPPGGHASTKNSPSESSTSGGLTAMPRS